MQAKDVPEAAAVEAGGVVDRRPSRDRVGGRTRTKPWQRGTSLAIVAVAGLLTAGAGMTAANAYEAGDLPKVEAWVRSGYADVAHMNATELASLIRNGRPLILFDVREADEFAVSHIPGAVRVDPGVWTNSFLSKFGGAVAGRAVVFYCSVGVRSSKLAGRVQAALKERGAEVVYNLEGGVFRWHNERRSLANARGPTERVHPYDRSWGKLIDRQNLIAIEPQQSEAPPAIR